MNYLSVCSGVEAASVAWKGLGWNPLGFSEIEKFPSEVLQHHYPNVPNLGDMTKYKEWNFGNRSVDLVVGGTPCQSFSVAGLRKGMEDPRGNLALTFCAILDKFRPKWFVWENVPGVLSSNKGRDFGSFLGAVAELRYGASYRVLDAQNFGVPQRRRRVFVVGHLGDWKPTAEVLFESESLRWHPKKSREARKDSPGYIEGGFGGYNKSDVGGTTRASGGVLGGGSETFIHVADKEPTLTSSAAGFSRVGNDTTADSQYIGTAYNITFCDANGTRKDRPKGGLYVNETKVSNTLTNAGVGTNVVENKPVTQVFENHPADSRVKEMGDTCHSVTARWGTGGGNIPFVLTKNFYDVVQEVAVRKYDVDINRLQQLLKKHKNMSIKDIAEKIGVKKTTAEHWFRTDKCFSVPDPKVWTSLKELLKITDDSFDKSIMTIEYKDGKYDQSNRVHNGQKPSPTLTRTSTGNDLFVLGKQHLKVRKLTPIECERLQGFPDNYTNIKENCPDGHRYKCLGNSMAVPVMKWIGTRINNYKEDTNAV